MMIKKLLLIAIFIISISPTAFSQNTNIEEKDSTLAYFYYLKSFSPDTIHTTIIDTTTNNFQKYDALSAKNKFYTKLGNTGLASRNLVFESNNIFGFDFGIHSYDPYLFDENNLEYYQLLSPHTNIFFSQGGSSNKKEQNFRIVHSQKVTRGLTLGIKNNIISSFGNYKNQKANNSNTAITASYFSKNKRYGFLAHYINNSLEISENGGIKNDSDFENNVETDRKLIAVNLDEAENRWRNGSFYLKQYYSFIKKRDSLKTQKKNYLSSNIIHSFKYDDQALTFTDGNPDTTFYPAIYKDSLNTFDKNKVRSIENKISLHNSYNKPGIINLSLSLNFEHKYLKLSKYFDSENYNTNHFNQYIPSADISLFFYKTSTLLKGEIKYLNGDYNDKDLSIKSEVVQFLNKKNKGQINLKLNYSNQDAPYFYNLYNSNHYKWSNNFNKTNTFLSNISYKNKIIETGIEYYNIKNFVYLNNQGIPSQYNKKLSVVKAYLYNDFKIKKLNLASSFVYQKISEKDILRLPEILANVSISYNINFFKGHLSTQTGIDINYQSKYFANAYMPALSSFYLQDDTEIKDYAYIDLFLNFKIRRTIFFVKYQHINQGLINYNYYSVPHYPLEDRIIKFGISWRFFD